jgi:PRTRC genetic system protein F
MEQSVAPEVRAAGERSRGVRGVPAWMGQLPRIGAGVPAMIHSSDRTQGGARLAQYLLRAGVVRNGDVPRAWRDPLDLCSAALARWTAARCGQLHHFNPKFDLALEPGQDGEPDSVLVMWSEDGIPGIEYIGAPLTALEQAVEGLGATVLAALDRQCSYPLFTPNDAIEEIRDMVWGGEDDEQMMLDEYCDDEEDREARQRDIISKEKVNAAFPAWVRDRPRPLSHGAPRKLACVPGKIGQVARVLRRMRRVQRRIVRQDRSCSVHQHRLEWNEDDPDGRDDGVFLGHGMVLAWTAEGTEGNGRDLLLRVYDDIYELGMNGGCHDWLGRVRFDLGEPQQLRHWLDRMGLELRMVGLLDQLLDLLDG